MLKKIVSLLIILIALITSCKNPAGLPLPDPEVIDSMMKEEFIDVINDTDLPDVGDEYPPTEVNTTEEVFGDTIICQTSTMTAAAGYSNFMTMQPSIIHIGGIFDGKGFDEGSVNPLTAGERAPIVISISLPNVQGSVSAVVESPSLSTVREAIQEILNQNFTGSTPAQIQFEVYEFQSLEQLQLHIGAEVGGGFGPFSAQVAASFDSGISVNKSYVLVKFVQVYYSLDMDIPASPADFYLDGQYPLADEMGDWSPVYSPSMKVGRQAFFTVESTYSAQEVKSAVNASFSFFINGSGEVTSEQQSVLNESSIKAFIYGGSSTTGAQVINGFDALSQHITEGANFSPDSPGLPLSFNLKFLKDNSDYRTVLSTEYTVRECEIIPEAEPEIVEVQPLPIEGLCPLLVGIGDPEFHCNGPNTTIQTRIYFVHNKLYIDVRFHLIETNADWTEGLYMGTFELYTADDGKKINRIIGPTENEITYLDCQGEYAGLNDFIYIENSFIDYYISQADGPGDDVEDCEEHPTTSSQLAVYFNSIQLEVVEE